MENQDKTAQYFWPSDEQPCVWMDAGIVSYKLCDRNYDCEHCPFDASMQSRSQSTAKEENVTLKRISKDQDSDLSPLERILSPFCQIAYDPLSYYGASFWRFIPKGTRRCRIGLNDLGFKLLPFIDKVIFPQVNSILQKDDPFCQLVTKEGPLRFSFPVDGKIRLLNRDLLAELRHSTRGETIDSWFVEFDLLRNEELAGFKRGQAGLDFLLHQQNSVVQTLVSAMNLGDTDNRPTLQDGGVLIPDVKDIIGSKHYYQLAINLFCR